MKLIDWLDKHLVPDWRNWWRWASVQVQAFLATIAGLFGGQAAAVALGLAGVTQSDTLRVSLMACVGLVWFASAVVPRLLSQSQRESDDVAPESDA